MVQGDVEGSRPDAEGRFVKKRTGNGAHRLFVHPGTGQEVWVTIHGHLAGQLGNRIFAMPE